MCIYLKICGKLPFYQSEHFPIPNWWCSTEAFIESILRIGFGHLSFHGTPEQSTLPAATKELEPKRALFDGCDLMVLIPNICVYIYTYIYIYTYSIIEFYVAIGSMRAGCILQISPGIWSGPVALPDLTWRKAASRSDSVGNSSTSRTNLSARRSFKLCHQSLRCSEDDIRSPPSIVLKKEIHLSKAICGSGQIWPSSMESCGNGRWLLDLALLLPMNGLSVCKIADAEAPVPSSSMRSAMPLHLAIRSDDLSRLA